MLFLSALAPMSLGYNVKTFIINNADNILYVGGNGPNNYTSIQSAINDTVDGDTVFVYDDKSPYYENIILKKSINLIGENRDTTVIDGDGSGDVVNISANNVAISDFTIQNSGINHYDSGLQVHFRYFNITMTNNNIFHNTCGIYLSKSWDDFIEGNNISFNQVGIWTHGSSVTISDNVISNNLFRGIYLNGDENLIINNIISGNLSDLYGDEGIEVEYDNNIISGNLITECDEPISLHTADNNKIIGNNICYNKEFIWLDQSNRNIISQNNFINTEYQEKRCTFSNSFYNKWESNYWNRQRILPYLIFGEIEIEIFGIIYIRWFNIDWTPAKEPYNI